jgi:WD40 repeat protein
MSAGGLSLKWEVEGRQEPLYTGGKVELWLGSGGPEREAALEGEEEGAQALEERRLACWCEGDVAVVDSVSGAVELRVEADEEDAFTCFATSLDSSELVTSGSRSGLLTRWETVSGEKIKSWKGHSLPVTCMDFDPSGVLLATGSMDRTVRVWNWRKGFATHSFKGHAAPVGFAVFVPKTIDPSSLLLVSASHDGEVRVWNLHSKQCKVLSNHASAVTGACFGRIPAPSSSSSSVSANFDVDVSIPVMVTVSRDKIISIWNLATFSLISSTPAYETLEGVVAFQCDRGSIPQTSDADELEARTRWGDSDFTFVTCGHRGLLRVWNAVSRECVYTYKQPHAPDAYEHELEMQGDHKQNSKAFGFSSLLVSQVCPVCLCMCVSVFQRERKKRERDLCAPWG